ncbi:hypothetical protein ACFRNR_34955, partial [Streptomyces sp. NPDC056820]
VVTTETTTVLTTAETTTVVVATEASAVITARSSAEPATVTAVTTVPAALIALRALIGRVGGHR